MAFFVFTALSVWCLCGYAGYMIGESKGRAGTGCLLGFLLGFIGLFIIAVMPDTPERRVAKYQEMAQLMARVRVNAPPMQQ